MSTPSEDGLIERQVLYEDLADALEAVGQPE
jgi:hypothetical protein